MEKPSESTGEDSLPETKDSPHPSPELPDNITQSGQWSLSTPSFSSNNALIMAVDTEIPVRAHLSINVQVPAILEYEVFFGNNSTKQSKEIGTSDLTTSWDVTFELEPGEYEVWAIMRTGGPNDYVVELKFEEQRA